ncbi:hypothetical protein NHQ30_006154 [Ciborinia camelliae]|nr:hypothetical protein NHQ30_006154 [Ciborinia camelliae]
MANDTPTPEFLAQDIGGVLTTTAAVFIVLLIIFAILRGLAQRTKGRDFGLEDLFSYFGLFFILGECIIALVQVPVAGVGRHVAYLEISAPKQLANEYIIMYPIEILYISAFTFPKLSILCLYLKIFVTRITRNTTYILIAIVIGTWIAETTTAIFQCWPIQYIWNKSIVGGHCVNQDAMFQFWSIPNIVTDTAMLVLPMPTIWNLQTSLVQKLGLTFTFLLGSLGLVASCVRFAIFTKTAALNDATWASVELQIWTIVEPSMYFLAGILPTLRPVLSLFVNKFKTIIGSTKSYGIPSTNEPHSSRSKEGRHVNGVKQSKNWAPLPDDLLTVDGVALVEYSQNVQGGTSEGSSIGERKEEPGIRKTQEVVVTRVTL